VLLLAYRLHLAREQREQMALLNAAQAPTGPNALPPEFTRYLHYLPPTIPPMVEA
jgi:hypothetical protein